MTDRHKSKSKYTADRGIPGAFEGETMTRRRMMTGTVHATGAIATAAFVLPALGFAMGPLFEKQTIVWQDVGGVNDFPDNNYIPRTIQISPGIGETGKSTVYMRKHNDAIDGTTMIGSRKRDQYDNWIALTSRCAHLGCPVGYKPAAQRFICPCHGGVYDFLGRVSGGPPVRPLDRFYTRVRNGRVQVGPRYSVNSHLERFSPRDSGESLDGVGQYLYPSRPSIRKLPGT